MERLRGAFLGAYSFYFGQYGANGDDAEYITD
jgi:hypothetical protein